MELICKLSIIGISWWVFYDILFLFSEFSKDMGLKRSFGLHWCSCPSFDCIVLTVHSSSDRPIHDILLQDLKKTIKNVQIDIIWYEMMTSRIILRYSWRYPNFFQRYSDYPPWVSLTKVEQPYQFTNSEVSKQKLCLSLLLVDAKILDGKC